MRDELVRIERVHLAIVEFTMDMGTLNGSNAAS
jgi:hypothetical protein